MFNTQKYFQIVKVMHQEHTSKTKTSIINNIIELAYFIIMTKLKHTKIILGKNIFAVK